MHIQVLAHCHQLMHSLLKFVFVEIWRELLVTCVKRSLARRVNNRLREALHVCVWVHRFKFDLQLAFELNQARCEGRNMLLLAIRKVYQ